MIKAPISELIAVALLAAPSAFAASQTWSNAPVDANWATAANWIGNAAPGGINLTGIRRCSETFW